MLHTTHADIHTPGNIEFIANDVDICIVLISNAHHLRNSPLWYDAGNDYSPAFFGKGKVGPLEVIIKSLTMRLNVLEKRS